MTMKNFSTALLTLMVLILCSASSFGQQQQIFKRTAVIPPPINENGGYGNTVIGDVTGSGSPQIYAVNNDWTDAGAELIPKIYEFKFDGTKWDSVWSAVLPLPRQNTWPPLAIADLDGDGKKEVVWGPVNNLGDDNTNPPRIVVFEAQGGGSDALGVADGSGGYKPNATFTITDSVKYELRPFKWVVADVNNDNKPEIIFADRKSGYKFGVVSVNNIPDNADGSETWKLDTSGLGSTMSSSTIYDIAVMDSTIYVIHSNGTVTPVFYANGSYTIGPDQADAIPGGSWKSAEVVDLAGDGNKEIIVGQWLGGSKVFLLQPSGDTLKTTEIADFASLGCNRLNGGAMGDVDGDGHMDFIYGSRTGYATPNASVYRLSYLGGDITNPFSYKTSIIDSSLMPGGQYDIVAVGNTDSDTSQAEIVYSGIPRASDPIPLVVLKMMTVDSLSTIAQATVDADGDFSPDKLGETMKVIGVVNGVNMHGTTRFSYTIQDGSNGMTIFNSSIQGPVLPYGARVMVTGTVAFYRGTTELDVADPNTDVTLIDTGRVLTPVKLTIPEYLANGEKYGDMLIELDGVAPTSTSAAWPAATKTANMTIWDGYNTLTLRIDGDTELGGMTEPTWPVNLVGVASQYSYSTPANDGYQIIPSFYNQFTQGVAASPSAYFFFSDQLHSELDTKPYVLTDSTEVITLDWSPSIDLNGDNVIYQVAATINGTEAMKVVSNNGGADTILTVTGADVLEKFLNGKDTVMVDFNLFAKSVGTTEPVIESVDTLHVTFINGIVTGIDDNTVPYTFYVDQNYPNPFNPTTTIRFGLHQTSKVDLRIYDVLGQQVAVLLNNKPMQAGSHEVQFNASHLASGTYIYRLRAGDLVETRKMVLMK